MFQFAEDFLNGGSEGRTELFSSLSASFTVEDNDDGGEIAALVVEVEVISSL